MARFADQTISDFVEALANSEPTPGGGTAAAVAGAIGTSLLMMVAGMSKIRGSHESSRTQLDAARTALASTRARMLALADQDSEAYNSVIAAYRLPKATDEEKATRKQAIGHGVRAATDAPLETFRTVVQAGQHARIVAQFGNPSAASDVRVALELLEAAASGAAANVEANLAGVTEDAFKKTAASTMIDLSNQLTEDIASARAALAQLI